MLDVFDQIFYEYDKSNHKIPGMEEEFFFRDQKSVFEQLKGKFFSYSGPTSMGKSFVVQTYIEQQIENPEVKKINYATESLGIIENVLLFSISNYFVVE